MVTVAVQEVLPVFLPGQGALLFHAVEYLLFFLPLVVLVYFCLGYWRRRACALWLLLVSVLFYAYWQATALWLVLVSVLCNFAIGLQLVRCRDRGSESQAGVWLTLGVVANLVLLGYYKYLHFFLGVADHWRQVPLALPEIILPVGISFFTFTQIAYLVDVRRGIAREYSLPDYALFVTYFPHLIAGPILHHKEMMPQFSNSTAGRPDWKNIYQGLFLIAAGIIKKVVFADSLAFHVDEGFAQAGSATLLDGWMTAIGYTLQLYFDFSGYTDMAIGASLILNIRLPLNFNSPYKALHIREFWLRWHMTLSRWLRDYLYIPMGGSRHGIMRTLLALMVTFLLGGLWHGAGWTFVVWGALHGLGVCGHRLWQRSGFRMPMLPAFILTFLFVVIGWVFFRAETLSQALDLLAGMMGVRGVGWGAFVMGLESVRVSAVDNPGLLEWWPSQSMFMLCLVVSGLLVVWGFPNSSECLQRSFMREPKLLHAMASGLFVVAAIGCAMFLHRDFSHFIYFYF